jgi:Maf-like protein/Thiamine monophosphate synthase
VLLYYITDRTAFPGDEPTRRARLLEKIAEAASQRIDYIQLREKDLPTRDLETLAREAMSILRKLRTENRELRTASETTLVTMSRLSADEIRDYVATGEPMDKAGAYAIQGLASRWIPRIEGDYSNVVGLPVALVYEMLRERGRV